MGPATGCTVVSEVLSVFRNKASISSPAKHVAPTTDAFTWSPDPLIPSPELRSKPKIAARRCVASATFFCKYSMFSRTASPELGGDAALGEGRRVSRLQCPVKTAIALSYHTSSAGDGTRGRLDAVEAAPLHSSRRSRYILQKREGVCPGMEPRLLGIRRRVVVWVGRTS